MGAFGQNNYQPLERINPEDLQNLTKTPDCDQHSSLKP